MGRIQQRDLPRHSRFREFSGLIVCTVTVTYLFTLPGFSHNENMMNFQYIKDLDNEHLNASFELKEIVLSLNEDNVDKSSSSEEKIQEVEKRYEGLILKELPKHLKFAF